MKWEGRRQSTNVLDMSKLEDFIRQDSEAAIANARLDQERVSNRSDHLRDHTPLNKQKDREMIQKPKSFFGTGTKSIFKELNSKPGKFKK